MIVGVNGKPVRRLPDLTEELERVGVGKKVPLRCKRDGHETLVEVEVMDIGRRGVTAAHAFPSWAESFRIDASPISGY